MSVFVVDRPSVDALLAVLENGRNQEVNSVVVQALIATLERKINEQELVKNDSTELLDRFENFFDQVLVVEAELVPLPVTRMIKLVDLAIDNLQYQQALDHEPDIWEMYAADNSDYEQLKKYLETGQFAEMVKSYWQMDTASREYRYGRTKNEDHQLRIFLNHYPS